jgi:hypothetical protein
MGNWINFKTPFNKWNKVIASKICAKAILREKFIDKNSYVKKISNKNSYLRS